LKFGSIERPYVGVFDHCPHQPERFWPYAVRNQKTFSSILGAFGFANADWFRSFVLAVTIFSTIFSATTL
jgi:hypothetical protein